MTTPGIDVRPLRQINGGYHFNEVFLTEVAVPHDNVIGAVDDGWRVAMTTLTSERFFIGSGGGHTTARHVMDLARRLGSKLHIVRSWAISSAPKPASATGGYVPPMTDFEAAVLDRLRADIESLALPDDVDLDCHVLHGKAARRLLEAARHADMLVLGARGVGGFMGLRLGSTADQVVRLHFQERCYVGMHCASIRFNVPIVPRSIASLARGREPLRSTCPSAA